MPPIFADNWDSRTVGTNYGNGDQTAIGPPVINDWGLTAIHGFANWTVNAFSCGIRANGFKANSLQFFTLGGGAIEHQTSSYYHTFTLFGLYYMDIIGFFFNLVEVLNKDPDPEKSGSVLLFRVCCEGDGSISVYCPFVKDSTVDTSHPLDNSQTHIPYMVMPMGEWSLLQVNVTLTENMDGFINLSTQVALNGYECCSVNVDTAIGVSQMYDKTADANFFSFNSSGRFDNLSMYNGNLTLGEWPDYDTAPTGIQKAIVTQGVAEFPRVETDGTVIITQAEIDLAKQYIPTLYVTQAVIELLKKKGTIPPPPPGSGGWMVKEA